jgi:hypothetical protein
MMRPPLNRRCSCSCSVLFAIAMLEPSLKLTVVCTCTTQVVTGITKNILKIYIQGLDEFLRWNDQSGTHLIPDEPVQDPGYNQEQY